ncbi:lipopolysaccharide-induced tumor necrosis factor-alpha factor homolog [Copidosoma floridanum]|uniref:lipopolysaccharide-induced tumor necrosis factor-alpha factor homolog n=1 Tax=Copidosoma floridanum TaxID=29053 RepID=UPI0006C9861C|nr:lipopolysaccharide-induced tumor necrosis factor-alpha factor homolog [Copidosoma floridanum]
MNSTQNPYPSIYRVSQLLMSFVPCPNLIMHKEYPHAPEPPISANVAQPPPYGAVSPPQQQVFHLGGTQFVPPLQDYRGGPVPAPYLYQSYSGAQQQQPVINVQPSQPEVIVVQNPVFGSEPQNARCPHCHTEMFTRTETAITPMTHTMFILCCLFGSKTSVV